MTYAGPVGAFPEPCSECEHYQGTFIRCDNCGNKLHLYCAESHWCEVEDENDENGREDS